MKKPFVLSVLVILLLATTATLSGKDRANEPTLLFQTAILAPLDAADNDLLGYDISLSGNTAVVGAHFKDSTGVAYLFERNQGGADKWGQVAKLSAGDAADRDGFGSSVAIDGDTVVIGALWNDAGGDDAGAAYVFQRHPLRAAAWIQVKKLLPADLAAVDLFGNAVAISHDTIVVGAYLEDGAGRDQGAAYVFERNAGGSNQWGQVKKLTAADSANYSQFGRSVAISGDAVIVGSPLVNGSGAAYVFGRNVGGANQWGQMHKLTAPDAAVSDLFGLSVAIDYDTAAVGAPRKADGGTDRGAVYLFGRDQGGSAQWGQIARLSAADSTDGDWFGDAVAIAGNTAVIGADWQNGGGSTRGAAYVFQRTAPESTRWVQVQKLTASDVHDQMFYGSSLAISADSVLVGAYHANAGGVDRGAVYAYARRTARYLYLPLTVSNR